MNSKASAARMISYVTCCKWCLQKRRFLTSGRVGDSDFTPLDLKSDLPCPSRGSNLKTKSLTLAASLQSNVFNVLKFGSPSETKGILRFGDTGEMIDSGRLTQIVPP